MDGYIRLAKEFHSRNNKKVIGVCVGEITNLTPVTIRIYYNGVPLEFTEFFNVIGMVNGNTGQSTGDLYVEEYPVNIGDKFICLAGADNQSIYLIDKFERINNLNIYLKGE